MNLKDQAKIYYIEYLNHINLKDFLIIQNAYLSRKFHGLLKHFKISPIGKLFTQNLFINMMNLTPPTFILTLIENKIF